VNPAIGVDPNILCMKTVSDPSGIGAPVKMRAARPGGTDPFALPPAMTRSATVSGAPAAVTMSANRTAYPSTAEFVKGGSAIEAMRS
jgi:hypothetical protein